MMMNGVFHPPLDVADPDGRAREFGRERVDLDPMQDFRPDARHGHAETERLAIEDRAPLDVLHALKGEIEEIARAAGGVENTNRAEPVDESVALGFRLGARGVEALAEIALGIPAAPAGGFEHGRHDRLDPRLRRLPFGAERAQHDWLYDHLDLVWIGVVRADLRPLVGVEKTLEQGAEDRRIDQAPVEPGGGE